MLTIRVFVALCKPEVDDVDVVFGALSSSNQEIVGLNITVDDSFLVNFLNALDLKNCRKLTKLTI